ncbi:hypothetical protein GCM10027344_16770 [Spelaeicoccus albus]
MTTNARRERNATAHNTHPTTVTATSTTAPGKPAGHGTVAAGIPSKNLATPAIQSVPQPAHHATNLAAGIHTAAATIATTPRIVAAGTAGAANKFAGTAYNDKRGRNNTITGAQNACAAAGTATANAKNRGITADNAAAHGRTQINNPAHANTDNANPKSRPNHGSATSSTTTAKLNAGNPRPPRPDNNPNNATHAITADLSTLGSGPTTSTYPTNTTPAPTNCNHRTTPTNTPTTNTAPERIAKFEPDTATRCVRPVSFIDAPSESGTRDVSPSTSPGSKPAESGAKPDDACLSPVRRSPVIFAIPCAGACTAGSPNGRQTAADRRPASGKERCSLPLTLVPGASSPHDGPAKIVTGARSVRVSPPPVARVRRA